MFDKKDITHANKSNYAKIRAMETNKFKGGELFRVPPEFGGGVGGIYDDKTNQYATKFEGEDITKDILFRDPRVLKLPAISHLGRNDKCANYLYARRKHNYPREYFFRMCSDNGFYNGGMDSPNLRMDLKIHKDK